MVSSYIGVQIWKQGVEKSGSLKPEFIMQAIQGEHIATPQGSLYIDPRNRHLWKPSLIARMDDSKQLKIVWRSSEAIEPVLFPSYKTRRYWNSTLFRFYSQWNNSWEAQTGKSS